MSNPKNVFKNPINYLLNYLRFLEAQLLFYFIDVTDSLRPPLMGRLAVSTISPLFVIRFRRSLQFCHLKVPKEAISDDFMAQFSWGRGFDLR